jgi:membrane protease YdiL (CAAX protease family)
VSTRPAPDPRPRPWIDAVAGVGVVLAGVAILASRPFVAAGPSARTALFAGAYAAIGVAACLVPLEDRRGAPRLSRSAVLALGAVAVVVAAWAAGRPVAAPRGPATLPLAILAAVAEEALFRRAAYGWLARLGTPIALVGSAALFALVHLPAYGVAALPVDLGAGLLLTWQRWASGTWTAPATTHVLANVVAVLR